MYIFYIMITANLLLITKQAKLKLILVISDVFSYICEGIPLFCQDFQNIYLNKRWTYISNTKKNFGFVLRLVRYEFST